MCITVQDEGMLATGEDSAVHDHGPVSRHHDNSVRLVGAGSAAYDITNHRPEVVASSAGSRSHTELAGKRPVADEIRTSPCGQISDNADQLQPVQVCMLVGDHRLRGSAALL